MLFTLPELPYASDALEPVIDAYTVGLHHRKHHSGYVSKLNEVTRGLDVSSNVETLISQLGEVSEDRRDAIRNYGGGHANHSLFWECLTRPGTGGEPEDELVSAMQDAFRSYYDFRNIFSAVANECFGSGWAWLCVDHFNSNGLFVSSTENQDNPLMSGYVKQTGIPILCLDLWEHSYYITYRNRRADYIKKWWSLVDWGKVSHRYRAALNHQTSTQLSNQS